MAFVADEPPAALTETLTKPQETDGDLRQVAKATVTSPAAWAVTAETSSSHPATGSSAWSVPPARVPSHGASPPARQFWASPCGVRPRREGYADNAAGWIDGVGQRLDIANTYA